MDRPNEVKVRFVRIRTDALRNQAAGCYLWQKFLGFIRAAQAASANHRMLGCGVSSLVTNRPISPKAQMLWLANGSAIIMNIAQNRCEMSRMRRMNHCQHFIHRLQNGVPTRNEQFA